MNCARLSRVSMNSTQARISPRFIVGAAVFVGVVMYVFYLLFKYAALFESILFFKL